MCFWPTLHSTRVYITPGILQLCDSDQLCIPPECRVHLVFYSYVILITSAFHQSVPYTWCCTVMWFWSPLHSTRVYITLGILQLCDSDQLCIPPECRVHLVLYSYVILTNSAFHQSVHYTWYCTVMWFWPTLHSTRVYNTLGIVELCDSDQLCIPPECTIRLVWYIYVILTKSAFYQSVQCTWYCTFIWFWPTLHSTRMYSALGIVHLCDSVQLCIPQECTLHLVLYSYVILTNSPFHQNVEYTWYCTVMWFWPILHSTRMYSTLVIVQLAINVTNFRFESPSVFTENHDWKKG
jgi:hypothetical protein